METQQITSNIENMKNILEEIEAITHRTNDQNEIREALQSLPNFDIGDLSLDAEIYFALAIRYSSLPYPDEEAIEECGMTDEEVEADMEGIATLGKIIKTLGSSIDLSYFELQPKGDDFKKLREIRTSTMQAILSNLEK